MQVYKITNKENNKAFIGSNVKSLSKKETLDRHRRKKLNFKLYTDIQKQGVKGFKVEMLNQPNSLSDLEKMEEFYIRAYDTLEPNGYNTNYGVKIISNAQ